METPLQSTPFHTRARHGSISRYLKHKCKCTACLVNWANYAESRRIRRSMLPPVVVPHGTINGYANYKCRCPFCRAAMSTYQASYAARRASA